MSGAFASRLLRWQSTWGRHDLPWQNTQDAYRIWLSEVMLQQTQVATVRGYYQRFLAEFPTVSHLAQASESQVLTLWQGLGYYTRARNLHACAQIVATHYGGFFPCTVAELEKLPGIGRSTAGAIASFAFAQRAAILDGNVKRVLCRYAGVWGYPEQSVIKKQLWQLANDLLPDTEAGRYNQALMDLGSSVCLPKNPVCDKCPVQADCVGYQQGVWPQLPTPKPKQEKPSVYCWVLMVFDSHQQLLMQQQESSKLWKGLWMPPVYPIEQNQSPQALLQKVFAAFHLPEMSAEVIDHYAQQPWMRHELTHRRFYFKCCPIFLQQPIHPPPEYCFTQVRQRPVPKVVLKLLDHVTRLQNNYPN